MSLMNIHAIPGKISTLFAAHYPNTDTVLLLDTGCARDYYTTLNYLQDKSLPLPKLVVVSHAHPDHAGGAIHWQHEHDVHIVAPRGINDWYNGTTGWLQHRIDLGLTRLVESKATQKGDVAALASWLRGTVSPSESLFYPRTVPYNMELDIPDIMEMHQEQEIETTLPLHEEFEDWQVVSVPGHTDHMVALFHGDTGTLYAADTVIAVDKNEKETDQVELQSPLHMDFPSLHSQSLERLSQLPVEQLLLAHGGKMRLSSTDFSNKIKTLADRSRNASEASPLKGWRGLVLAALMLPTRLGKSSIRRALLPR